MQYCINDILKTYTHTHTHKKIKKIKNVSKISAETLLVIYENPTQDAENERIFDIL